jgi:hypothetical protein
MRAIKAGKMRQRKSDDNHCHTNCTKVNKLVDLVYTRFPILGIIVINVKSAKSMKKTWYPTVFADKAIAMAHSLPLRVALGINVLTLGAGTGAKTRVRIKCL